MEVNKKQIFNGLFINYFCNSEQSKRRAFIEKPDRPLSGRIKTATPPLFLPPNPTDLAIKSSSKD